MLLRKIFESPSKTLAISLAVFCFGILLGVFVPFELWPLLLVLSVVCLFLFCVFHKKELRFICILLSIFCFAFFRYTQTFFPPEIQTVAQAPNSPVRVSGIVAAEVERRINTQRIILSHVTLAEEARQGKLLVWAPLYPEMLFGDELVLNCALKKPEPINGFAYDRYLASQGVLAVCSSPQYIDVMKSERFSFSRIFLSLKEAIIHRVRLIIPEPHASFLSGLLFGGSSSFSKELKDDFAVTGISHILAASGSNISLFSSTFLAWILGTRIGRRRGLLLTFSLLILYVFMAGATPAVVRAGIMGSLVLLSQWISRKVYLVNVFLLTASVMFLFNPLLLLNDVGFQLSFVATIAILTVAPILHERFFFIPELLGFRQAFAASLAAIVFTLPILFWHFGELSLVAPLVNLLVLPFIPYAMALSVVGLIASLPSVTLGILASTPAWSLSSFLLTLITYFGAIPFARIELHSARFFAVLVAGVLMILFVKRRYASS